MKIRLDKLIGLKEEQLSRNRIQSLITNSKVRVEGHIITKNSALVDADAEIELDLNDNLYVSRAGYKLDAALDEFGIDLEDKICLDIGASTGGFTQVMLNRRAKKVYALDVGTNQLAPVIRADERVVVMEHTNARYLDETLFDDIIDFVSCDVSFISLKLIIPAIKNLLKAPAECVVLVKPQFEVGAKRLNKRGVLKDERDGIRALNDIAEEFRTAGFKVLGDVPSSIRGASGNQEYLLYARMELENKLED